jgi:hypothetical protein
MVTIRDLAEAAISGDNFALRSLYQDFLRESPQISKCQRPQTNDVRVLAAAASLVELFAERLKQSPPAWAAEIGPLQQPIYLVPSAKTMKHLRVLCESQSPKPLHKRGFYAPPNFLEFA